MTTEEKFWAAVNVIRSLPKDGAYQPSRELQLKFYTYFKQATEGRCDKAKPAFWDVVGRVKWDAWKKLGDMSKEEAMQNYVRELKNIVETMSYNDNVGKFLESLGSFYDSVPMEDIEMLLGPVLERVRSQPGSPLRGSPLGSRETSPTRSNRVAAGNKANASSLETSPTSSVSLSPHPPDTDDEDEEFIDTVETTPHASRKSYKTINDSPSATRKKIDSVENGGKCKGGQLIENGNCHRINGGIKKTEEAEKSSPNLVRRRVGKQNGGPKSNQISDPIREAVLHLQKDLDRINARVRTLETNALSLRPQRNGEGNWRSLRWWPFSEATPKLALFILAWPFIAHFIVVYFQQKRRRYCKFSFFFSFLNFV